MEGKIATAWHSLRPKKSINVYKNACATWSNTLLAWLGSISVFGEPASRFISSARTFGNMEEGKIATAWAQFIERSPSMYIRMRCYLGVTLLLAGQVGIISAPGEPASRFTS
jgi:hypothetical protein